MTTARTVQARIRAARIELAASRAAIERDVAPWRRSFERRRTAWMVGGGFAGGFALSCLPIRLWARIGALIGSGAALVARSLVAPMIAAALLARKQDRPGAAAEEKKSAAR